MNDDHRSPRHDGEEDRYRRKRDDYERERERRRSRRDDDRDYPRRSSRRDDDYSSSRNGDDYYFRSRRDRDDDVYNPPRSRYNDDHGRRRGDWRSGGPRDSSPPRRSRTPEGTIPISERPRPFTKWDIAAPGFEGSSALQAKATGIFGIPGQSRTLGIPPPSIAMANLAGIAQGVLTTSSLPPIHMGDASSAGLDAAGLATHQSKRLYVGNITVEATEPSLVTFFNQKMQEMKLATEPGDSCVSAQVNTEKGYAFIEFRNAEEATNAMSFDGIVFQAQSLKIRRPKDYVGPDARPPAAVHVPGVISTNVPDSPNKIFVGGLPTYLSDEQVIELLQSFGELRAFNLVKEGGAGGSKGFAFCEYVDPALTDLACQGLNDMELGDRRLVVQRASIGSDKKTPAQAQAAASTASTPGNGFAGAGGSAGEPTRCMVMLNMVTPTELQDDEEYADIVEDIREECTKYGAVTDVRIPRPAKESKGWAAQSWKRSGQTQEREGVGRVYVRYAEVDQCSTALRAIAGRQFGGRLVICAFLNEVDWPANEDGGQNTEVTANQASGPAAAVE